MANYEDPKITVTLDDESKELLRALVRAVDRIAPDEVKDVSFGDNSKRLVEFPPEAISRLSAIQRPIKRIQYGGRTYNLIEGSNGDYLLHDDEHEGEDTE